MIDDRDDELTDDEYLLHYGTPRHSGRYPWGSGDSPYQRSSDFLSRVEELKKKGLSEAEVASSMGVSSTRLRALVSLAKRERRTIYIQKLGTLKEEGISNIEIADKLGLKGESTVRSLLNNDAKARMNLAEDLADNLKKFS